MYTCAEYKALAINDAVIVPPSLAERAMRRDSSKVAAVTELHIRPPGKSSAVAWTWLAHCLPGLEARIQVYACKCAHGRG